MFFSYLAWALMPLSVIFYLYAWRTRKRNRGYDIFHNPKSPGGGKMFSRAHRPTAYLEESEYVPAELLELERRRTRRRRR